GTSADWNGFSSKGRPEDFGGNPWEMALKKGNGTRRGEQHLCHLEDAAVAAQMDLEQRRVDPMSAIAARASAVEPTGPTTLWPASASTSEIAAPTSTTRMVWFLLTQDVIRQIRLRCRLPRRATWRRN